MVHAMSFQLSRRSMMSIWTAFGIEPLQPLMQGVATAIALGGATLVWLDRSVAADPRRVAGLVAATLGALQLAANHWAPLYLLWLAPPAMVALLGPLGARAAAEPAAAPNERARAARRSRLTGLDVAPAPTLGKAAGIWQRTHHAAASTSAGRRSRRSSPTPTTRSWGRRDGPRPLRAVRRTSSPRWPRRSRRPPKQADVAPDTLSGIGVGAPGAIDDEAGHASPRRQPAGLA